MLRPRAARGRTWTRDRGSVMVAARPRRAPPSAARPSEHGRRARPRGGRWDRWVRWDRWGRWGRSRSWRHSALAREGVQPAFGLPGAAPAAGALGLARGRGPGAWPAADAGIALI